MTPAMRFLCICSWLVCLLNGNVFAHEGRPVFIQVKSLNSTARSTDGEQQSYSLQWKIPPVFAPGTEPSISLSGKECSSKMFPGSQGLIGKMRYTCNFSSKRPGVKITYPDVNPALSSLLVFLDDGGSSQHVFSGPETLLIQIPDSENVFNIARQYINGGIKHILLGWDHLLFVLCLLILAGSTRRILITISGFTLAHSLTLVLTALTIISLPILLVEALIALSIVVLAAETFRGKLNPTQQSLTWRYPALVASLFGLLHGFGFASILGGLGLPQNMKMTALMCFNLGIELGQLVFIAVVLVFIAFARKIAMVKRQQDNFVRFTIYLAGITASYWMVQRLVSI